MSNELQQNLSDKILHALKFFRPAGSVLLVSIDPSGVSPPTGKQFTMPDDAQDAVSWAIEQNKTRNVYWTPNLIEPGINRKAGKKHVVAASYYWADCDPDVFRHGGYDQARNYLISVLAKKHQPNCSAIVDSGNGLQIYWGLDNPQTDLSRYEEINAYIGAWAEGPGTFNCDRILRLPGTFNYPTQTKLKKGYPEEPSLSTLLFSCEKTFSEEKMLELASGSGTLQQRLNDFLSKNQAAKRRYSGDTGGLADTSGSAMDMSMVSLLKIGGFTLEESRRILEHWGHGSASGRKQGTRYWDRMWQNSSSPAAHAVPDDDEENPFVKYDISPPSWAGRSPPEREWTWANWMPRGVVTGLSGPPGAAKSTLAQQIAAHQAIGRDFLGDKIQQQTAVYITCEDDEEELWRRQDKINAGLGISHSDLENLHLINMVGQNCAIVTVNPQGVLERTKRFRQLLEFLLDIKADAVYIDLLTDFWNGNEIIRQQVNGFVKHHLAHIAQAVNCSVTGIFHPSQSGLANDTGESGSTAWSGSFRSRLYLSPVSSFGRTRKLRRMKANYAPIRECFLEYDDGLLVETIVTADEDAARRAKTPDSQHRVMEVWARINLAQRRNLATSNLNPESSRVLRRDVAGVLAEEGMTKGTIDSAILKLRRRGFFANDSQYLDLLSPGQVYITDHGLDIEWEGLK